MSKALCLLLLIIVILCLMLFVVFISIGRVRCSPEAFGPEGTASFCGNLGRDDLSSFKHMFQL